MTGCCPGGVVVQPFARLVLDLCIAIVVARSIGRRDRVGRSTSNGMARWRCSTIAVRISVWPDSVHVSGGRLFAAARPVGVRGSLPVCSPSGTRPDATNSPSPHRAPPHAGPRPPSVDNKGEPEMTRPAHSTRAVVDDHTSRGGVRPGPPSAPLRARPDRPGSVRAPAHHGGQAAQSMSTNRGQPQSGMSPGAGRGEAPHRAG